MQQLSLTVREIVVEAFDVPAEHPFPMALRALEGKSLTPEKFIELLLAYTKDPPPTVDGISLSLERMGDGTGVSLRLKGLPAKSGLNVRDHGWRYHNHLTAGKETLAGGSGACTTEHLQKADGFSRESEGLKRAFATPTSTTIEGLFTMQVDEN